jgi:hypothetical protein
MKELKEIEMSNADDESWIDTEALVCEDDFFSWFSE